MNGALFCNQYLRKIEKKNKQVYKIKLENHFTFKDRKGMWKSLKEMSCCVPEKKNVLMLTQTVVMSMI